MKLELEADLVLGVYGRESALKARHFVGTVSAREVAAGSKQVIAEVVFDGGRIVARCCELVGILTKESTLAAEEVGSVCRVADKVEVGLSTSLSLAWGFIASEDASW